MSFPLSSFYMTVASVKRQRIIRESYFEKAFYNGITRLVLSMLDCREGYSIACVNHRMRCETAREVRSIVVLSGEKEEELGNYLQFLKNLLALPVSYNRRTNWVSTSIQILSITNHIFDVIKSSKHLWLLFLHKEERLMHAQDHTEELPKLMKMRATSSINSLSSFLLFLDKTNVEQALRLNFEEGPLAFLFHMHSDMRSYGVLTAADYLRGEILSILLQTGDNRGRVSKVIRKEALITIIDKAVERPDIVQKMLAFERMCEERGIASLLHEEDEDEEVEKGSSFPLYEAVLSGRERIVALLAEAQKGKKDEPAMELSLQHAAAKGTVSMVSLLLDSGYWFSENTLIKAKVSAQHRLDGGRILQELCKEREFFYPSEEESENEQIEEAPPLFSATNILIKPNPSLADFLHCKDLFSMAQVNRQLQKEICKVLDECIAKTDEHEINIYRLVFLKLRLLSYPHKAPLEKETERTAMQVVFATHYFFEKVIHSLNLAREYFAAEGEFVEDLFEGVLLSKGQYQIMSERVQESLQEIGQFEQRLRTISAAQALGAAFYQEIYDQFLELTNTIGDYALAGAVETGEQTIVRMLLATGQRSKEIRSFALLKAVQMDHENEEIVELLLWKPINEGNTVSKGGTRKKKDPGVRTRAIFYAARNGYKESVELLLKGCNEEIYDEWMNEALEVSIVQNHREIVDLLFRSKYLFPPSMVATAKELLS